MNNFQRAQKFKKATYKILLAWTKNKEKIQEKFEIFWSKSLWKIDFIHNFLLNIYWISASAPKVYTPLEAYFDTVRACLGVAAWGFRGRTPPDAGEIFKNVY